MNEACSVDCKCGASFDPAAGKYGCPNCNGDSMTTSRQSRRRARILEQGGMQLSVLLQHKAATCLYRIQELTGETHMQIVERLLVSDAAKPMTFAEIVATYPATMGGGEVKDIGEFESAELCILPDNK